MSPRSSKLLGFIAPALLLAVAAYWYWSPLLALGQMKAAAKASDATAFNAYVDYPRLRESLKSGVMGQMGLPQPAAGDRQVGGLLGNVLVSGLIDALVRPEMVMRMMKEGAVRAEREPEPSAEPEQDKKTDWVTQREGMNTLIAYVGDAADPVEKRLGLVMERSGFASWRLVGMRMPPRAR